MSHSERDTWNSDSRGEGNEEDIIEKKFPKFEQKCCKADFEGFPEKLANKFAIRGIFRVAADKKKVWEDVAEAMMDRFIENQEINVSEFLLLFENIAPGFDPLIMHFWNTRRLVWNSLKKIFEFTNDCILNYGITVNVAKDGVIFHVAKDNYKQLVFGNDRDLATCSVAISSGGNDAKYGEATKSITSINEQLAEIFRIRKNSGHGIVKVFFDTPMEFMYDMRTVHLCFPLYDKIVHEKTIGVDYEIHKVISKEGDSSWSEVSEIMKKLYECYGSEEEFGYVAKDSRIDYVDIPERSTYFMLDKDIKENNRDSAEKDIIAAEYELCNFNIDALAGACIDEIKVEVEEVLKDMETLSEIVNDEHSYGIYTNTRDIAERYSKLSDAIKEIDVGSMTYVMHLLDKIIYMFRDYLYGGHIKRQNKFRKLRPGRIEKY